MSHATSTPTVRGTAKRTGISLAVVIGAVVLAGLVYVGVTIAFGDLGEHRVVVDLLATDISFLLVGLAFLRWSGAQPITVDRPTASDLRVGGFALVVAVLAEGTRQVLVALTAVGAGGTVPASETIGFGAALAMIAMMVLVAPPVEEFLFRGVIQRYVRDVSSTKVGIAVATLLFVPIHALGILMTAVNASGVIALVGTLVVVSVAFGISYARTDNLIVPIGIHAAYNATTVVIGIVVASV